jgi:hypothetical protein
VTALLFFIVVGALLLGGLFLLWRGRPAAESEPGQGAAALLAARNALQTLQYSLLAPELIGRIFAAEDQEYVNTAAPERVRQMFLEERRRISLLWIGGIRAQVSRLLRHHRSEARFHSQLNLSKELMLLVDCGSLLLSCRALQAAVYLRGPYGARALAGRTVIAAARLCDLSGQSLEFLNAASAAATLRGSSARGRAAL